MSILQLFDSFLTRFLLACIDARAEQVKRDIESKEAAIGREIARVCALPIDSVSVTFSTFSNGMVCPKIEIKRPLSKEQQRDVDAILATFNPIPMNAARAEGQN